MFESHFFPFAAFAPLREILLIGCGSAALGLCSGYFFQAVLQRNPPSFVSWTGVVSRLKGEQMAGLLRRSLKDLIRIELNDQALDALQWRNFGNGLSMARLAREGARELVLYRIAADAAPGAFFKHEHIGGEFYLVLRGRIADETGEYGEGDIVYLDPQSVHTPRARGYTVVLVLWPAGVRLVD